jgi:hypothetical protein
MEPSTLFPKPAAAPILWPLASAERHGRLLFSPKFELEYQVPKDLHVFNFSGEINGIEVHVLSSNLPLVGQTVVLRIVVSNSLVEIPIDGPGHYHAICRVQISDLTPISISLCDFFSGVEPLDVAVTVGIVTVSCSRDSPTTDEWNSGTLPVTKHDLRYPSLTSLQMLSRQLLSRDPLGITLPTGPSAYTKFVRKEMVEHWTLLEDLGVPQRLIKKGLIPLISRHEVNNPSFPLALSVPSGWSGIVHTLFSPSQLSEIIRVDLEIETCLLSEFDIPFSLLDGHYDNFRQFHNGQFRLVDVGSITRVAGDTEGRLGETPLAGGIIDLIRRVCPLLYFCRQEETTLSIFADLWRSGETFSEISQNSDIGEIVEVLGLPKLDLKSPTDQIEYMKDIDQWRKQIFGDSRPNYWSNYAVGPRKFFEKLSSEDCREPSQVLETDRDVIVDSNEEVVDQLHDFVSLDVPLPISIMHAKVNELDGTVGGADVVLALALSHHVLLGPNSAEPQESLNLGTFIRILRSLTQQLLLVEFMPLGHGSHITENQPHPNPLPDWYSLDRFVSELSNYFSDVQEVNYEHFQHQQRVLLVCQV